MTIYIEVKSTNTRDCIPPSEYEPDMPFTMVLMEENKSGKLGPRKVGEGIASMSLDEFLDCLNCVEEDAVWWSFKMNDLVGKGKGGK